MTPDEKRAYAKAQRIAVAERKKLMEATRKDLVALLKEAREKTVLVLAGAPSEYQQWQATALQSEIDRVLVDLGRKSGDIAAAAAGKAWAGGLNVVDAPLAAIGIVPGYTHLDTNQLLAMRSFMVDRIADISTVAASTIKRSLGLAMMGSNTIPETIAAVTTALGDISSNRATTIVRTELGRVWSVAADERAKQANEAGIKMDKIWRRSGKLYPRLAHNLADGRRIPIDEAFTINGHKMRFPHDPKAPASETINCGCICLYRPRDTPGTLPDRQPSSD